MEPSVQQATSLTGKSSRSSRKCAVSSCCTIDRCPSSSTIRVRKFGRKGVTTSCLATSKAHLLPTKQSLELGLSWAQSQNIGLFFKQYSIDPRSSRSLAGPRVFETLENPCSLSLIILTGNTYVPKSINYIDLFVK